MRIILPMRLPGHRTVETPPCSQDSEGIMNSTRGLCLVQKRQLILSFKDLCRRLSHPVLERSGQVGLIEVAGRMNGINYGDALLQQIRRVARPLDLAKGGMGHTGGPE